VPFGLTLFPIDLRGRYSCERSLGCWSATTWRSVPSSVDLELCKTTSGSFLDCHKVCNLLHLSSFDLDLPIECDDEYWENEDPEKAFKQPADKPSTVAYFNCFLKLGEVLGYLLRTIVRLYLISSLPDAEKLIPDLASIPSASRK
jgi:hypothetical protein